MAWMALVCMSPYPSFFRFLCGEKNTLTGRVRRYHGTMDVQQERLNVYFNEVCSLFKVVLGCILMFFLGFGWKMGSSGGSSRS